MTIKDYRKILGDISGCRSGDRDDDDYSHESYKPLIPKPILPDYNFLGKKSDDDDDDYWKPSYSSGHSSMSSFLDKALEHDLSMFGSSNTIRMYDTSIDYSESHLTRTPIKLAGYTGELVLSTAVERQLARTFGKASLPTFGQSLVQNIITGIPSAGISYIYGEPTDARDELGLTGLVGLATLVFAGPIAAFTVLGFGFLKFIARKLFG